MVKKISFILKFVALSFGLVSNAQQIPHYTQYLYNLQILNPAYIGNRSDLSIGLNSRFQWIGVEGSPQTQTLSINSRIKSGIGLGATFIYDKIGFVQTTNVNIDASYTIQIFDKNRLSVGLKGGMTFFDDRRNEGFTPDRETYESVNGRYPNIGVGLLYYNDDYYVSLSVPHFLKTPLFKTLNNEEIKGFSDKYNVFLSSGYVFDLNPVMKFKPSFLAKYTPNLPLSVDINANFLYRKKIEFGASYRYNDSLSLLFAFILKEKYRIGYTYDHTLTHLNNRFGAHEISLQIDLGLGKGRWIEPKRTCAF